MPRHTDSHTDSDPTLAAEYLTRLDAYWRAAN